MNLDQGREFTLRALCLHACSRKAQAARGSLRLVQYAWETIDLSVCPGALNCILLAYYVNLSKFSTKDIRFFQISCKLEYEVNT